jgi:hypothetical protein
MHIMQLQTKDILHIFLSVYLLLLCTYASTKVSYSRTKKQSGAFEHTGKSADRTPTLQAGARLFFLYEASIAPLPKI